MGPVPSWPPRNWHWQGIGFVCAVLSSSGQQGTDIGWELVWCVQFCPPTGDLTLTGNGFGVCNFVLPLGIWHWQGTSLVCAILSSHWGSENDRERVWCVQCRQYGHHGTDTDRELVGVCSVVIWQGTALVCAVSSSDRELLWCVQCRPSGHRRTDIDRGGKSGIDGSPGAVSMAHL